MEPIAKALRAGHRDAAADPLGEIIDKLTERCRGIHRRRQRERRD
jgi:hypothetical protein